MGMNQVNRVAYNAIRTGLSSGIQLSKVRIALPLRYQYTILFRKDGAGCSAKLPEGLCAFMTAAISGA